MSRRHVLLAATLVIAACGGDDDGGGGGGGGDPEGFTYTAARACSDVLNERDGDTVAAGQEAAIEVLLWSRTDDGPSEDERTAAADAIEAYRDELQRSRDELADLDPDEGSAAAWDDYLALFDAPLDGLALRADQARSGDGEPQPGDTEADGEQMTAVLEDLRLVGRDCEVVFSHPGPPAEHRAFVVAAAEACTTVVSRRQASDHDVTTGPVLDAVAAVVEDEPVERSDTLAEALDTLVEEWEATADDFRAVDGDDAPAPEEWAATVATAEERVAMYRERGEVLESGDDAELAAAFEPGALMEHPSFGDFGALGLDRRDCRSVAA